MRTKTTKCPRLQYSPGRTLPDQTYGEVMISQQDEGPLAVESTNPPFDLGITMDVHIAKRSVTGTADAASAACLAGAISSNRLGPD